MSFSLRWLFTAVAIAALFAAAFTYQTEWWSSGIVALTLTSLIGATVGLALRVLPKPFWLAFCIAGWIYFTISFTDINISRLAAVLPTTRAAHKIWVAFAEPVSELDDIVAAGTVVRIAPY